MKKLYSKSLYSSSFNEGNEMITLEIISTSPINELKDNIHMIGFSKDNQNYIYRLASLDKDALINLAESYQDQEYVSSMHYNTF